MQKISNILDYSYPSLDPAVFNSDLKLYEYQQDFILRILNKMYVTYDLKESSFWIEDVVLLGSLTTSKWLLESDMDIHIRVNLDKFIETNMPGASKEEAFAKLDETRKLWDRAKILAPMTNHPIEAYFESMSFKPSNTEMTGVYSLLRNGWIKAPVLFEAGLDMEESKKFVIEQAEALAGELDSSLGAIKRDIQRVSELETIIKAWGPEKQQLFYAKVEAKLNNIEKEIIKDLKIKQDLVDSRHENMSATSDVELKFKWLQRFGFFGILSNLKTLMEQTGGKVTTQELPLIDKIISEARLRDKYLIDPSGKVIPMDGMDHGLWIMRNRDSLEKQYGIKHNNDDWFKVMGKLIEKGWVRITLSGEAKGGQFGIDLQDFRNIPSSVDNFIAEYFNPKEGPIYFANAADQWVAITDPFPSAQKAINKAIQRKRMGSIKEAANVFDVNGTKFYKNPTKNQIYSLLKRLEYPHLRFAIDPETRDLYIWSGYDFTHTEGMKALGIPLTGFNYQNFTGDIKDLGDIDFAFAERNKKLIQTSSIKEAFLKEAFGKETDTLLIDFDSTLAEEHEDGSIGKPLLNAKESLDKLKNLGYDIEIYSVRANDEKGLDDIKEWLDKYNIPYDSIFQGEKPRGLIIDDHAIEYKNWEDTLGQVIEISK